MKCSEAWEEVKVQILMQREFSRDCVRLSADYGTITDDQASEMISKIPGAYKDGRIWRVSGYAWTTYVDGKSDFPDVVGASVMIEIVPSTYKDKNGNDKERNELSMYGIKTIDEWEASEAEKAKGGSGGKPKRGGGKSSTPDALPGMNGASSPDTAASGTATATSKTDDFSDM